uniref:Uncharacterized protein n=1 Tax=Astyanax mexicanus TaxID=7994 RepID=A0A3B1JVE0_ASTMX
MEEEEKNLMEEGEKKEREMMDKARESWEQDSQEIRFKRLQHLLEKSNIYAKFLLTKMEQQQLEVCFQAAFGGEGWVLLPGLCSVLQFLYYSFKGFIIKANFLVYW